MASLSLREGIQERILIEGSTLQGTSVSASNALSLLNRKSGYTIKYAHNSHEIFWLNGKKIHLAPGESLFINLKYCSAYQYESSKLSRGLCLYCGEEEMRELYQSLKRQNIIDYHYNSFQELPELRFERQTHLNQILKKICLDLDKDLYTLKQAGFLSVMEEMLLEIDWELIGYNRRLLEFSPATRQSLIRKVIAARKFMADNLHRPIQLDDIAKAVGMSPFHFQRQYKKATGKSPNRHLTEWRMERAKDYLKSRKYSISEVSTLLAYNDLPTFSKAFKRELGCSPRQWLNPPEIIMQ